MDYARFEWKNDYNIGVEIVDKAHKQLCSILNRLIDNLQWGDPQSNKRTCMEAIKYLKDYTIKHFAEEEEYQKSIGFHGYAKHKQMHDNMRDIVIPALEREMESKDYSLASIKHFTGAYAGWFMHHVLIDDQAIVGKVRSKWLYSANADKVSILEDRAKVLIYGMFQMQAELVSHQYDGYEIEEAFYCEALFTDESESVVYRGTLAIEMELLLASLSVIMNKEIKEIDDVIAPLAMTMASSFISDVTKAFAAKHLTTIKTTVLQRADFYAEFDDVYPDYSLLWRTNCGYFAFCLNVREQ